MDRGRAWRIATGAMLLAVGASRLLPPATKDFALAFGGALFGASLGVSTTTIVREKVTANWASEATGGYRPLIASVPGTGPLRQRIAFSTMAVAMALGAGLLIAYPLLTHTNSAKIQASSPGAKPSATIGHAVPPRVDPQLHVVGLGQRFVLNRASVTVEAANICRSGDGLKVYVQTAIQAAGGGEVISEPDYQLLDSSGAPHQPAGMVSLDQRRGSGGHAVPPPSVYRESINFRLPVNSAKGPLRLQAVLPSGSGPEYRVVVGSGGRAVSSSGCVVSGVGGV
jgi:hypothetical protein